MRRQQSQRQGRVIREITRVLRDVYPTLRIVEVKPEIVVRGVFPVRLERTTLDYYMIDISFPDDYPVNVPTVRELSSRIPNILDRHVLSDGKFCLFLPEERWKYWGDEKGVRAFLEDVVNDFLLSQTYFERHGRFPFGERRHGIAGILDFYTEELGTNDISVIARCIDYLSKEMVKGSWDCYCGSGEKLRQCHRQKIRELRWKISPSTARQTQLKLRLAAQRIQEEQVKVS